MSTKICTGCAEILQTEDINKKGYIPIEKYLLGDKLICRRCFRLKNYSEIPNETEDKNLYSEIVRKTISNVDIVMPIFDAIDLEPSMTNEILDLLENNRVFVVLNKIDLLPKYYVKTEIARWFKNILIDENIFPEQESYISAKSNFGLNGILKKLKTMARDKKDIKVAVIGASNVGKSSILNRLLNKNNLTVSKFSGTTKGSIKNKIKFKDITITFYDTPGLIPEGRIQSLLNPKKAVKLVPNKEISRKTFKLKENQYFMLSNLVYFRVNSDCEIQVFASKNIEFHVTSKEKYSELLNRDFFKLLSKEETEEYLKNTFITKDIILEKGYDLSIGGLGFIEVKKGEFNISITAPENVLIKQRNSISKFNKMEEDEEILW
ncbi:GTPase [Oceanivirga salmonicida]|uniref:GTPase n=1 Tax=Oceanivirga salmonicida TaxID=1769291 RepID=UPI000831433D|nr:GTPase [Oceanivirga salmonicida]